MTAAKVSSNKSDAKCSLLSTGKYREQIFDAINSIKIFRNNPSLNSKIIHFLYYTTIMVLVILLTPFVFAYFLAFPTIFLLSIIATRGSFLTMTSELKPKDTLKCVVGEDHSFLLFKNYNILQSEEERVMWIWCLIIAYTLSELISSFVYFRKTKNKPSTRQFLSVIIPETFHTIGIALMIFEVLPKFSFDYFMLFLIWCVFEWGLHTPISTIYKIKKNRIKRLLIGADVVILGLFIYSTIFHPFDGSNRNINSSCWIAILALAFIHGGLWQDDPNSKFSFADNLPFLIKAHKKLELVKDSIFAWVSLWKIFIFIAMSLIILASQGDSIPRLFTMVGPAFSHYNITLISSENKFQSISIIKSLRFPFFVVLYQVIISIIVIMKPNKAIFRFLHGFDFRSRWGLNLPVFFSIAYVLWFQYIRSLNCSVIDHVSIFEQFKYFYTEIERSYVISRIPLLFMVGYWHALLLKISFCWILLRFTFQSKVNEFFNANIQRKTETPQKVEVYVVSKNKTVDEKNNRDFD